MNTAQFLLISLTTLTAMHTAKLFLKEGPICQDPAWPAGLNSEEVEFLHGVCRDPFFHRHAVPEDFENQTTANLSTSSSNSYDNTTTSWSRRHIAAPLLEWLPYILLMQIAAQLSLFPVVAAGIGFCSSPPTLMPNGPQQNNLSASTIIVCVLLVSFNSLMLRCLDFKTEDNAAFLLWPLTICECWLYGQGQLFSLLCSIGISVEEVVYSRLLIATTTVFVALALASRLLDLCIRKRHHHQPLAPSTAINHCRCRQQIREWRLPLE